MAQFSGTAKVGSAGKKGARIFLEGLGARSNGRWSAGTHYTVQYSPDMRTLHLIRDVEGKRKVSSPSKGGAIDLTSGKVLQFTAGYSRVAYTITPAVITITLGA